MTTTKPPNDETLIRERAEQSLDIILNYLAKSETDIGFMRVFRTNRVMLPQDRDASAAVLTAALLRLANQRRAVVEPKEVA